MVINEFHKFNNYDTDSEKEFTLECFIKSRVNGCIRDAIAEDKGLGINRSRILHNIMKAKAKIAAEKGITEDEVRVEDIHNRLKGSVSKKLVMELLELERGTVSIAEMDENGEQIGDGKSGIVTCFDNEMDFDTRKILDETFEQFSNLDIYILMKEFGLFGEEIRKQEMCDFVITTEFQKLLAEDMTIRSKSDPIKTAYNKKIKIKKVLASLAGKINMAELEGTLEAYVEEKWKSIVG